MKETEDEAINKLLELGEKQADDNENMKEKKQDIQNLRRGIRFRDSRNQYIGNANYLEKCCKEEESNEIFKKDTQSNRYVSARGLDVDSNPEFALHVLCNDNKIFVPPRQFTNDISEVVFSGRDKLLQTNFPFAMSHSSFTLRKQEIKQTYENYTNNKSALIRLLLQKIKSTQQVEEFKDNSISELENHRLRSSEKFCKFTPFRNNRALLSTKKNNIWLQKLKEASIRKKHFEARKPKRMLRPLKVIE